MAGKHWRLASVALLVLLLLTSLGLRDRNTRFHPSTTPAYVPSDADSFSLYLEENRARIRGALESYYFAADSNPFIGGYTLDQVLEMRAPYELRPDPDRCEASGRRRGILLVHGLTDSPYLLRSLAEALARVYPCALLRGLLSPGHGTIPGDLQTVTLGQWTDTFAWGVESFRDVVDELYVIGYSNGGALALHYLQQPRENMLISKLVLLSPGLESTNSQAYLSPYISYLWQWIDRRGDRDAAKYESFPSHAAALFYQLTSELAARPLSHSNVPTLMVTSSDDSTTRTATVLQFFCEQLHAGENALVLYKTAGQQSPALPCEGISIREPDTVPPRFIAFSHIAMTLPMEDPHYGMDGNYAVCLAHEDRPQTYSQCLQADGSAVYAENNFLDEDGFYDGTIVRRSAFNPDFPFVVDRIRCFIDAGDCND